MNWREFVMVRRECELTKFNFNIKNNFQHKKIQNNSERSSLGALTDALNLFFTCRCYVPRITRKLKAELAGNKAKWRISK